MYSKVFEVFLLAFKDPCPAASSPASARCARGKLAGPWATEIFHFLLEGDKDLFLLDEAPQYIHKVLKSVLPIPD